MENVIEDKVKFDPVYASKSFLQSSASVALSFLPQQNYLDTKLSWYDSDNNIELSKSLEFGASIALGVLTPLEISSFFFLNALCVAGARYKIPKEDEKNIFGTKEHVGSFALEYINRYHF